MKKSRYTEDRIVRILRETDRDTVAEVAKRNGALEASIYAWQKHFGGMGTNDVKHLKDLQVENDHLKKLLAERDLVIEVINEINSKKWYAYKRTAKKPHMPLVEA